MDPREGLYAALAGGTLFRCDPAGSRVLAGGASLAKSLGIEEDQLKSGLGALLGKEDPKTYADLFGPSQDPLPTVVVPYRHPKEGLRWLSLRREGKSEGETGFLVFMRDETAQRESLLKLARIQSRDVENSARFQAAVLMEGQKHEIPGIDYQTATIPSKYVDGDFLDVLRLSKGSVDFLLGDVMGKGMDAAIVGAMIKFGFARTLASKLYDASLLPDPAEICGAVDLAVVPRLLERQSFATLTYARLEESTRSLEFVDCGHTSIIHYSRRTGECWRVKGGNMPMGFAESQDYRSFILPLDPGDCLLFYTDGLSECSNRWGEVLGEERVAYLLRTYSDLSAAELTGTVLRIGFSYSASGFNDDVSLVCIKDEGAGEVEILEGGLSLVLGADQVEALEVADQALSRDLEAWFAELTIEGRSAIVLALHEALVNVLEHSLPADGGPCDVRWRKSGDLLSLELSYVGPDYDWISRPVSPVADFADSGYGRLILDASMDSLFLSHGFHGKKRLVLCRDLGRPT